MTRRGVRSWAAKCLCCAAHGLSCLVTVRRGAESRTMLFDTGPEEYAFERNVTRLAADLGAVEAIMLSHGHWDHAGAMLLALTMIRSRNGGKQRAVVRPSRHVPHAGRQAAGRLGAADGRHPDPDDLDSFGAEVVLTREPQYPLGGLFHVSGEIKRADAVRAWLSGPGAQDRGWRHGSRMNS